MKPDDRHQLRRLLDTFDEAGLIALANKGLVRRAQKDQSAGGMTLEEADAQVIVRGPDWTVWMPADGPQHAKDDTKATGVTRQILTATIFLRDTWHPVDAAPIQPADEPAPLLQTLLDITLDDLIKWTNKTLVREIVALLKSPPIIEVQIGAGVSLKAIEHGVELRVLPAKKALSVVRLLERIMSTAPKALHERWVVTILLAYQISQGRAIAMPKEPADEPTESLRTRPETLLAVQALLENMVTTGLAHPSQRMIERLFTLSLSALAVGLPRLSRMVRTLADDVGNILTRDAAADTQTLLDRTGWTWALCQATLQAGERGLLAPRALIGAVRTQYDPVGDLRLIGVGAYPWQTASGFEGVTVLFWDEAASDFRTWSASRPTATPGRFDLDQVYRTETPWAGGGAPERLSRSRFLLRGARANAIGRLSAAAGIQVDEVEPANPCGIDFLHRLFNKWSDLQHYSLSHFPLGLLEPNPLDAVVILEPSQWGERFFDEIQQRFCWPIADAENRVTLLTLPWVGVNETAIAFLEAVKPERDQVRRVAVRIVYQGARRWLEPLALLSTGTAKGDCVLNPAFDHGRIVSKQSALLEQLRKKYGRDRVPTMLTPDDDWTEQMLDGRALENAPPTTRRLFADLESYLTRVAEAGARQPSELQTQRLRDLAALAQHAGWSELANALARLVSSEPFAAGLLRTAHLVRLHHFLLEVRLHAIHDGA